MGAVCTQQRLRSALTLTASHSLLPPITGAFPHCAASLLSRTLKVNAGRSVLLLREAAPADSVCSGVFGQTLGALPRRILTLERVRLFWSQRVAVNCGNASARFMCVQTRKPLTCHFNEILKWLVKMCLLGRGLSVGAKESQAEA